MQMDPYLAQMMLMAARQQAAPMPGVAQGPNIYSQFGEAGPPPTGIGSIDPVMQILLPMIVNATGHQFIPYTPPGMQPWDANYLARSQSMYFRGAQQQMLGQLGGTMGSDLANMAISMGVNPSNMSVEQFRRSLVDMGQGTPGMFAAQALMMVPEVQMFMGGNPIQMQEQIFASRAALYGGMINPLNPTQQGIISAHATDFGTAMWQATHGTPSGGTSLLPNFQFTRGFDTGEMGAVAGQMAMQGFRGFVGPNVTGDDKVATIGQMNRIGAIYGGMSGQTSIMEIFQSLGALTNGQLPQLNLGQLEQTLQTLSSVAKIMGVHGSQVLTTMATVQSTLGNALGVGAVEKAMGYTAGEMQGVDVAARITQNVLGSAAALGMRSPEQINQLAMRQMALTAAGIQSQGGRDAMGIAWLEQQGRITSGTAETYRQAALTGNPAAVQGAADAALQEGFGNAGAGRAFFSDPNTRLQVYNQIQYPAQTVSPYVERAQDREFGGFVRQMIMRDQQDAARRVYRGAGRPVGLSPGTLAETRLGAMEHYLQAVDPDEGAALAATLRQEYEAGRGTVGSTQAMAIVQHLIDTTQQFAKHRYGLSQAGQDAVRQAEVTRFTTDPEVQGDYVRQAEMNAARRLSMSLGRGVISQIDGIQDKERRAAVKEEEGDLPEARRLRAEAQKEWNTVKSNMGPGSYQRKFIEQEGGMRGTHLEQERNRVLFGGVALGRLTTAMGGGVEHWQVLEEHQKLAKIFSGDLSSLTAQSDAMEFIIGAKSIDKETKNRYIRALDSEDFASVKLETRGIASAMNQAAIRAASGKGVGVGASGFKERALGAAMLKEAGGTIEALMFDETWKNQQLADTRSNTWQRLYGTAGSLKEERDKLEQAAGIEDIPGYERAQAEKNLRSQGKRFIKDIAETQSDEFKGTTYDPLGDTVIIRDDMREKSKKDREDAKEPSEGEGWTGIGTLILKDQYGLELGMIRGIERLSGSMKA